MSVGAPPRTRGAGDESAARLLASLDAAGESTLGRLRGRRWADTAAASLSNVSDYGYVWVALALWKARRPGPARRRAIVALAGAGFSSYGINKVAKRAIGRGRPDGAGVPAGRLGVRHPTSSSFPSGHTLAAFCTAMVLTEAPGETAAALSFAAAVAVSRVHLRAHHASDVVGGALIGSATGLVVRRLLEGVVPSRSFAPRRRNSSRRDSVAESMDTPSFAVTWDYLCPFARNAHEHLVSGLEAGAPWEVAFVPFSLMQAHVEEGEPPVWDQAEKARGVLALEAGIVVRDRFPEKFLAVHQALFAARHDEGKELGDPAVIREVLDGAGAPANEVFAHIQEGWPLDALRTAHEKSVAEHDVFGVPTFIVGDAAVFVRLMTRPENDGARARTIIERLVALVVERPELNEFKHTSIPR